MRLARNFIKTLKGVFEEALKRQVFYEWAQSQTLAIPPLETRPVLPEPDCLFREATAADTVLYASASPTWKLTQVLLEVSPCFSCFLSSDSESSAIHSISLFALTARQL